jgi:uracil-DNA glycosylase family 4
VDARQDELANPFGMDEDCRNCSALCETRSRVVHGYGDVAADFLFVGEAPDEGSDRAGIPLADEARDVLWTLERLGLCEDPEAEEPAVDNVFLTNLTRCRHPDRAPTDEEVTNCEPFLSAEIRMINPEILVPVGQRALVEIATEYTTRPADDFDVEADNGREIRGRGFELIPMVDPREAPTGAVEDFVEAFAETMGRDYRQTKGRRGR